MSSSRTCERCKHFMALTGPRAVQGQGICRRFPPVLNPKFVLDAASPNAALKVEAWLFPRVPATEYCGEYQSRPSSAAILTGR